MTESRALIIVDGGSAGVSSNSHADIQELMRVERPDGSGSVFFAWRSSLSRRGSAHRSRVGFVGIPDVRRVERLIREHILERAA